MGSKERAGAGIATTVWLEDRKAPNQRFLVTDRYPIISDRRFLLIVWIYHLPRLAPSQLHRESGQSLHFQGVSREEATVYHFLWGNHAKQLISAHDKNAQYIDPVIRNSHRRWRHDRSESGLPRQASRTRSVEKEAG
jgi:hypothetical protein